MDVCELTKKKLDRELQPKEIDFLKWVYEKHKQEEAAKIKTK